MVTALIRLRDGYDFYGHHRRAEEGPDDKQYPTEKER